MDKLRKQAEELALKFIKEESDYFLGYIEAEQSNPKTKNLSEAIKKNVADGVRMLQSVDRDLVELYEKTLYSEDFDKFRDSIKKVLDGNGKIILSGCGSSGRLCMSIDKSFKRAVCKIGKPEMGERVMTLMTGGDYALIRSVESFEDYEVLSRKQTDELKVTKDDLLIGVTATGETTSIVGSAIRADELGAKVYMVVCSDITKMQGKVRRIDDLYSRENVSTLYLPCGAFAIAGSSRMQSSTIEQLVIMSAFEMVLDSNITKGDLLEKFKNTLDYLMTEAVVEMMAEYIKTEAEVYKRKGFVTYFTKEYTLDVLTDTTERGPTFTTPPFRPQHRTDLPLSWAYVKNPTLDNKSAWLDCLGREPRCIEWEQEYYNSVGITTEIPDISKERMYEFVIGKERDMERESQDTIAVWIDSIEPIPEFENAARAYKGKHVMVFKVDGEPTLMNIFERIGMKMAINTVSTATMALYGRITGNYMTYLNISNKKLIDRGARIVSDLCGVEYKEALTELYYSSLLHNDSKDEVSATQETIKRLGIK